MKIQINNLFVLLLVSFLITSQPFFAQDTSATINNGLKFATEKKFKDEFTLAYKDYSKVMVLDPKNTYTYFLRGNCSYKLANYNDAITDYLFLLTLSPELHEVHFDLGNAYFSLGNFEKALVAYDEAIKLNNSYSNYYFNRAITEYNLGYTEDACADFNNAKDLGDLESESYIKEFCK